MRADIHTRVANMASTSHAIPIDRHDILGGRCSLHAPLGLLNTLFGYCHCAWQNVRQTEIVAVVRMSSPFDLAWLLVFQPLDQQPSTDCIHQGGCVRKRFLLGHIRGHRLRCGCSTPLQWLLPHQPRQHDGKNPPAFNLQDMAYSLHNSLVPIRE